MHILIIEDDLELGLALSKALKANGLTCEWLRRIKDVPLSLKDTPYDCVLLDLGLPDGNGIDLIQRWRNGGMTIPIIVITAKAALEDRLTALYGGADDYLIKPFATTEIIARIRVVLRRYAQQCSNTWRFGPLTIVPHDNLVKLNGEVLHLSRREFQLLLILVREPNTTVPKVRLAQRMEPLGDPVDFATIDVHISNLRKKLGANWIKTVRGIGYLFTP